MPYQWKQTEFKKEKPRKQEYANAREAAHALLFSETDKVLFGSTYMNHAIMMQLRFDGMLGFPGGYVDHREDIVTGLNRELVEEIALKKKYFFSEREYHGSWVHHYPSHTLIDHFYVKKYPERDFIKIEKEVLKSKEWGSETMGILRVPVQENMALAQFFRQNFVGNARDQLVKIMLEYQIMSSRDIDDAWALVNH